jgi:ribosomal-protein-serine acetyltransferase
VNPIEWDLGGGAVIRTLALDDAQELFDLVESNRERLRPWMPWEPMTKGPADTRRFIERGHASEHDMEGNGIWLDGRIVGTVGLHHVDMLDRKAELGYWIDAHAEGRGIVTRACERFCGVAFDELALHRVEILVAEGNVRSRAVAERLGMTQEGIAREACRVADGFVDLVSYAVLADDWAARSR